MKDAVITHDPTFMIRRKISYGMLLLISACILAAAPSWCEDVEIPSAKSADLFTYDEADPPEVFFFPKDKARWDGTKITVREWYMLSELQKQKFITEYLDEMRKQYNSPIDVAGMDYLKALNMFSYFSSDKSSAEPTTNVIDKLLSGQGKIAPKSADSPIQKSR